MATQSRVLINEVIENFKKLNIEIYESKLNIDFIDRVSSISDTSSNSLAYISNKKYIPNSSEGIHGLIVIEAEIFHSFDFHESLCSYLVVEHAKYCFASLYELLSTTNDHSFDFEKINQNIYSQSIVFGPDVYIGKNVTIGENTLIYPGVRILDDCVIGSNVVIKSNAVVGGSGFGYAIRSGFPPLRIPHLGNVIIGNGVEIGSNTAIDRGTFDSTVVEDFVKIDNGVHIAHNCRVGKRTLVIAHAELSGSVIVGHDSWIAPNVSIKESVKIGNNVIVGIGSVVLKDLPDNAVAFGVPAKIIRYQNQLAT